MMILGLVLVVCANFLRAWVSRTLAVDHQAEWAAEHEDELNLRYLNGKDFRRFQKKVLKTDTRLRRLTVLVNLLFIVGVLVFLLVPMLDVISRIRQR